MRVDLHPEARTEFRSAALWYEERQDRLGEEFVAAIAATLHKIGELPDSFPRWVGTEQGAAVIRKASVERFPYAIAFTGRPSNTNEAISSHRDKILPGAEEAKASQISEEGIGRSITVSVLISQRSESQIMSAPNTY